MWPFECIGADGKVYLHADNWKRFLNDRYQEYPHNWLHRRGVVSITMPRGRMEDLPGYQGNIACVEKDFSVIFQPFPAHTHTEYDPEGRESWNLIIEDKHRRPRLGEDVILFSTGQQFFGNSRSYGAWAIWLEDDTRFAYFRGKYWKVVSVEGGHFGSLPPPPHEKAEESPAPSPSSRAQFRSIDEVWEV